jgi:hypothetical protein
VSRRRGATVATAAAVAGLAALLAGCGARPPDLFAVERTGSGPNARLQMVVNDGGAVTCNGHEHPLDAPRLLRARDVARRLGDEAQLHLELPPGHGSILSYKVSVEQGTVSFSDTSAHLPEAFTAVEVLTKDIAEDVCGIRR